MKLGCGHASGQTQPDLRRLAAAAERPGRAEVARRHLPAALVVVTVLRAAVGAVTSCAALAVEGLASLDAGGVRGHARRNGKGRGGRGARAERAQERHDGAQLLLAQQIAEVRHRARLQAVANGADQVGVGRRGPRWRRDVFELP